MKTKLLFVAILIMSSCNNNNKDSKTSLTVKEITEKEAVNKGGDDLEIYDFNGLQPLLSKTDDTVYVINFWATWCAPCVKELPYFEDLYANYKDENVEVILVSLDFPHQFETKLKPFIKKNKLQAKVVVLDDVDSNSWIPKVNKDWSGSIPATIIYKNDKRSFFEKSFTYNELENELKKFLN